MIGRNSGGKANKLGLILAAAICLGVGIFLAVMFASSSKDSPVTLTAEKIEIGGAFGTTISWTEIKDAVLVDALPQVLTRNNGSGLGSMLKGEFTLAGMGRGRLYVNTEKPPFIRLMTAESYVFINTEKPDSTRLLFNQLKSGPEGIAKAAEAVTN